MTSCTGSPLLSLPTRPAALQRLLQQLPPVGAACLSHPSHPAARQNRRGEDEGGMRTPLYFPRPRVGRKGGPAKTFNGAPRARLCMAGGSDELKFRRLPRRASTDRFEQKATFGTCWRGPAVAARGAPQRALLALTRCGASSSMQSSSLRRGCQPGRGWPAGGAHRGGSRAAWRQPGNSSERCAVRGPHGVSASGAPQPAWLPAWCAALAGAHRRRPPRPGAARAPLACGLPARRHSSSSATDARSRRCHAGRPRPWRAECRWCRPLAAAAGRRSVPGGRGPAGA